MVWGNSRRIIVQFHEGLCGCGSGKPLQDCCGSSGTGKRTYFPVGTRGHVHSTAMNLNENDLNTEDDMKLNLATRCNSSIDKRSITQVEEMKGSSPGVQTVGGFKGWAFLRKLLNERGTIKFRIGNQDKYPISAFQIKATPNRLKQEKILQTPKQAKAIELQVRSYRSSQALDSYIYSYTWASKEYGQVAAVAYDNFQEKIFDLNCLAWMLYMWNEYSNIYHPKISNLRGWVAALEYTYWKCVGKHCSYVDIAKKYSTSLWTLLRKVQIIGRHYKRYPLDFNSCPLIYPEWEALSPEDKIKCYDEVKQYIHMYTNFYTEGLVDTTKAQADFYDCLNTSGNFWRGKISEIYEQFFHDYIVLDFENSAGSTPAHLFWDDHACRFPPHLREAAFNLIISHVGAYLLIPLSKHKILLEDIFTGQRGEVYGNWGTNIQEEIVPGAIILTRLLPVSSQQWIQAPYYVLLPDLKELYYNNFHMLMERLHPHDEGDFSFCKKRGENILKAYIMAIDELEQNTLMALKKPLYLKWMLTELNVDREFNNYLEISGKFHTLKSEPSLQTFLWMSYSPDHTCQWGYIVLKKPRLFIFVPPSKNIEGLIKDIRKALRGTNAMVYFRDYQCSLKDSDELQKLLINDLANYLNRNPEDTLTLLRQDILGDEEKEYEQGIFLLKIGSLLMEYLHEQGMIGDVKN